LLWYSEKVLLPSLQIIFGNSTLDLFADSPDNSLDGRRFVEPNDDPDRTRFNFRSVGARFPSVPKIPDIPEYSVSPIRNIGISYCFAAVAFRSALTVDGTVVLVAAPVFFRGCFCPDRSRNLLDLSLSLVQNHLLLTNLDLSCN
jgi:hypothetical protein